MRLDKKYPIILISQDQRTIAGLRVLFRGKYSLKVYRSFRSIPKFLSKVTPELVLIDMQLFQITEWINGAISIPTSIPIWLFIPEESSIPAKIFYRNNLHCFLNPIDFKQIQVEIDRLFYSVHYHDKFNTAFEYIRDHYTDSAFHVDNLCKVLGFARPYCEAWFKEHFGMPPYHYVLDLRIRLAKLLIQQEEILIKLIPSEIGFATYQEFENQFKKLTGATPSEYRRKADSK
ncbi:MAG: AraC family transcriptional regulator [bacterium]|nr:AraC family transcriptional regulator [bacterium]